MYGNTLTDIDELINRVRSKSSKVYIKEALNSHRANSNRASIIATWIAVSYDIIDKIKEIAEGGDKAAMKFIRDLNNAINNNNIKFLQNVEEKLLDTAFNEFEFLNHHEFKSLSRLKEDRNLCAHPAFTNDDILYQPSPELVRTYIVHAIKFLLINQPVQGKAAIERIEKDLKRASFPRDYQKTYEYLHEKYLKRAKEVLVKNLIRVLAKVIIKKEVEFLGKERQLLNSLVVISQTHPKIYKEEMNNFMNRIIDSLEDRELITILDLLIANGDSWYLLNPAAKIRIKNILNAKVESISDNLEIYAQLEEIDIEDFNDIKLAAQREVDKMLTDVIENYVGSRSFREAERRGEIMVEYTKFYKPRHLKEILESFTSNNQIYSAGGTSDIIIKLFDDTVSLIKETIIFWKKVLTFLDEEYPFSRYGDLKKRIEMYKK